MNSTLRTVSSRTCLRLAVATAILLALSACSSFNVFDKKSKDGPTIQGNRVSILTFDKPLAVSDSLADVPVVIPRAYLNEDWPQTGGYSSHTMYNLRGPARLKELWHVSGGEGGEVGSRVVMSPIVAEGKVFVLDTTVHVSAFDAKSGRGAWRTSLGISNEKPEVGFGGGLAYQSGKVIVATGFGDVFALSPADGKVLWRQKLGEPFRTPPTVGGGRIYVTSFNNQLFVLDGNDGHVLWNYRAIEEGAHILSENSPAVAGDVMVAPFSSGEIIAFLADNGHITWQDSLTRTGRFSSISTMNDIAGSPVIDKGQVYAVSHSGRMVSIDLRSGQRLWSQELASIETPWVAGDFIYVVTTEGQVVCLYRRDGSVKWITQLKAYTDPRTRKDPIVWNGPIMLGNQLMLTSSRGNALFLDPMTGKGARSFKVSDNIYLAPIIANNIVYVYTNDGDLIAYGDPAQAGRAHPSKPRTTNKAQAEPDEIQKDEHPFWEPRIPEWFPVF